MTRLRLEDHLLTRATWTPSPHASPRADWADIELVVLHCISLPEGVYGQGVPEKLFLGSLDTEEHPTFSDLAGVEVSAHLLILREGTMQQFVRFDEQAWHTGMSKWRGRASCNQFSIGIELEGCVDDAYTEAQHQALIEVLCVLLEQYPGIDVGNIVGHQEIAPGRKQDPGPNLDWPSLLRKCAEVAYVEAL